MEEIKMMNLNKYIVVGLLLIISLPLSAQDDKSDQKSEQKGVEEVDSKNRRRRTHHNVNFDLGMNNYLQDGKFPDATDELYTVKPFGSWYFAINSMTKVNVFGPLFFDIGGGLAWYNFKFQNTTVRMDKVANEIVFSEDTNGYGNYIKSKLGETLINVQALPGLEFGRNFRIYAGMYAGYRVGSRFKAVYNDGKRNKDIEKGNYYLTNVRYGVRAEVGFRSTNLFF